MFIFRFLNELIDTNFFSIVGLYTLFEKYKLYINTIRLDVVIITFNFLFNENIMTKTSKYKSREIS